jgi:hypothetical protein
MKKQVLSNDFPSLTGKISELKDQTGRNQMVKVPVTYDSRWGRFTVTLGDLRVLDSMYGINPRTQRKYLFKDIIGGNGDKWQSEIFKTIILRNPLPQIELSANLNEDDLLKFLIQDGQQRFRTIGAILNDCVKLPKSIEKHGSEYAGMGNKHFSQLSPELQSKVMGFPFELLIAFGLSSKEEYERFILINNGTPLSKQDRRSAQVSNGASYIQSIVDGEPVISYNVLSSNFTTTTPKYRMFDITVTAKKTQHTFIDVSTNGRSAEEMVAHWFNTVFHNKIQPIEQSSLDSLYAKFENDMTIPSQQLKNRFEKYLKSLNDAVLSFDNRKMMKGRVFLFSFYVLRHFMDTKTKFDTKTFIQDYLTAVATLKNANAAWNPHGPVDDPNVNQKYTRLFTELFRTGSFDYQIDRVVSQIFDTMILEMKKSNRYVVQDSNRKFSNDDKLIGYNKQGGCCGYCGKSISLDEGVCDHKTPHTDGGLTELDNLVVSCEKCNRLKGSLPHESWMILVENGLLNDLIQFEPVTA